MVGNILMRFGANLKIVNYEPERTKPIARYHPGGTEKNHKNQVRAVLTLTLMHYSVRIW
jgi:hypothetical protein